MDENNLMNTLLTSLSTNSPVRVLPVKIANWSTGAGSIPLSGSIPEARLRFSPKIGSSCSPSVRDSEAVTSSLDAKWTDMITVQWIEKKVKKYSPELLIIHIEIETQIFCEMEYENESVHVRILPENGGVKMYLSARNEISAGYREKRISPDKYARMKLKKKIAELTERLQVLEKLTIMNATGR